MVAMVVVVVTEVVSVMTLVGVVVFIFRGVLRVKIQAHHTPNMH